jgi:DNA-binding LacI/PurR family transcriptional regulator
MTSKLRVREIAQLTGVSISTVSRVLAGKANTSVEVRQKVLACARAQGVLADMSTGRLLFNRVTVFAPSRAFDVRTDIFYYRVIQGLRDALAEQEVHIAYCAIEEQDSDVSLFLKRISEPACEVAMLIGIDDPLIHEVAADVGKPCVLLNCSDRNMRLDSVSPNHQQIGEYSASFLIEHGHRNILTLMCLRRITMERRLAGVREAFANRHIEFDQSLQLVATSGFGASEAREAILTAFRGMTREQYPTAILAGGDFMATGAYSAFRELGLSVPGDISIMSMDGFNPGEVHDVPLTSVQVPRDELGEEALRLLQLRIGRPELPRRDLLLSGTLAVRESVKRIGSKKQAAAVSTRSHSLY